MTVLKIVPSEKVGEILEYYKTKVKRGKIRNNRRVLLKDCLTHFSNEINKKTTVKEL